MRRTQYFFTKQTGENYFLLPRRARTSMTPARRTPVRRGRPTDNDDTSATRATEPSRRGRRRQRDCRGVRAVAGVGRRTWCCRGRRAAVSGFKREVTINMLFGGGGGTASATAAVGNDVPCASRSAAAAFFARMDVRRQRWRGRRCCRAKKKPGFDLTANNIWVKDFTKNILSCLMKS